MSRARENADHYAGSTSASDLDSGTLAIARMAAGTVIKSSFDSTASATAIASTTKGSGTSTTLTVAHTANSTSNKLWIHVNLHYYIYHSAGMGFGLEIHDGSSVVSTDTSTDTYKFDQTGSTSAPFIKSRYNYDCQITAASTSALTYTVRVFKSAGTMQVQYGSQVSTISIQEIQV